MPQIFYRAPLPNKPKPTPSIITIKAHRPWLCPVLFVLIVVVIGVGGLFLHNQSVQAIGQNNKTVIEEYWVEQEKTRQQLEQTRKNNARLETQNHELHAEFSKLSLIVRTTQAEQETYSKVLQSLSQLQKENRDLKEELSFYQHLLNRSQSSKSSMPNGVIANVILGIDDKGGQYPYKLVLTQWTKEPTVLEGTVQIDLLGKLNNQTKRLTMKQITPDSINRLTYKLTYFQRIEGDLQLPKEFIPLSLIVRLFSKGQKKANEIRFKWKDLLKQEQL
ncbi:MAG TPA: hypothetical protein EYP59_12155 [Thiotrichaceae bacterium]|nr:hypothetical protein [Thiotrichaceae bacterium]